MSRLFIFPAAVSPDEVIFRLTGKHVGGYVRLATYVYSTCYAHTDLGTAQRHLSQLNLPCESFESIHLGYRVTFPELMTSDFQGIDLIQRMQSACDS